MAALAVDRTLRLQRLAWVNALRGGYIVQSTVPGQGLWHGNEHLSLVGSGCGSAALADWGFSQIALFVKEHVIPLDAESFIDGVVLALFFEVLKLIEAVFEVGLI